MKPYDQKSPFQQEKGTRRSQFVEVFIGMRHRLKKLSKEVSFLGLAVLDTFLINFLIEESICITNHHEMEVICMASIILAWKFQEEGISVHNIIAEMVEAFPFITQVIQAEATILAIINFAIPFDHTYAAMVRYFYQMLDQQKRDDILAKQCLAFYSQGINLSSDFVLCCDLGPKIVDYFVQRHTDDPRIRWVCLSIKEKRVQAIDHP